MVKSNAYCDQEVHVGPAIFPPGLLRDSPLIWNHVLTNDRLEISKTEVENNFGFQSLLTHIVLTMYISCFAVKKTNKEINVTQ